MLRFCGTLTLALNTSGALGHRMFGTALVDAVGPALLIGWSEVWPWMHCQDLRSLLANCPDTTGTSGRDRVSTPMLPRDLLARVRELDAENRAATCRPVSREVFGDQMQIGRDRAGAIVAVVRAERAAAEVKAATAGGVDSGQATPARATPGKGPHQSTHSVLPCHPIVLGAAAHRTLDAPLIVISENLNTHGSKKMRTFTEARANWLTVVQLPGYAPDLNAVEM